MKKCLVLLMVIVSGCAPQIERLGVINGTNGTNGTNGHSLVSQFVNLEESLECPNGGTSLDIYLDIDDSLTVSESDTYTNSLIACNGSNGLQGATGVAGSTGATGVAGQIGPQGAAGAQGIAGPVGPIGPQGPQGATGAQGSSGTGASIVSYTASSCTKITGTSMYVQKSGSNFQMFSGNTCNSSTKVSEVSSGESVWASSSSLAVWNGSSIRVITFN